jgi:succinoglycan biosynthesis transport protein ExoP
MNLSQFMLALRARRKAFALVMIATIVAAVAIAFIVPKRFVASTTIMVDMPDTQQLGTTGRVMSARERTGYIQTQVDLLQSGRVAQKVARDLKLAQAAGMREDWEKASGGVGNIDEWIAANLLEKLKVDVSASNVITVTYASSEARKASDVANAFAKAYIETNLALRTEPTKEAASWFNDQLKVLRTQVNQAQTKLTAYQKEKGITWADERVDVEGARLTELSTQLGAARNATYDAQTRYRQAQEVLASGTPDALPEIMSNGAITAARGDLTRAEAALQAASNDLGPNHPVMQRLQGDVQANKEKLGSEMKKVVAALGNAAQQAQRREDELKNALAEQHQRILAQKDYRIEMGTLTRDVDSMQRAYDSALTRLVAAQVESRANQTSVAVLTPAVEPIQATFPRFGLISILAVVVGALLAAGVVFLLETLDRRVRSRADLESRLAVPTLGRLSKWQPTGGRLLPAPVRANRALPHPW